eukprot:202267-Hanusia_phi.AAC.1
MATVAVTDPSPAEWSFLSPGRRRPRTREPLTQPRAGTAHSTVAEASSLLRFHKLSPTSQARKLLRPVLRF